MPYANIYWVKLKLELLNDKRFIFDLNDEQKWLFVGLLLLAGSTKNQVPADENYLKNRLNLSQTPEKVLENLTLICKVFPKTVHCNGVVKFKNFSKLHNPTKETHWNPDGTPKDSKNRVDKSRLDKIRTEYMGIKGWLETDLQPDDYGRLHKAIKTLLLKANDDGAVIEALHWIESVSAGKWEWTLETLVKKWQDYLAYSKMSSVEKKYMKKGR